MCQGSGGAGGGGQPGPHNRISGGGGGGGATGVWQIAIDKAGTYNVTAISGFNGGGPGSAGAGDAGPGAAKFAQSPALGSGYVIAYGGEGGKAGGPQGDNPGGEGGTNATSSWTAASLATDIAGEDGVDAKEYDTDLNYTGAITFCNEEKSETYWCYFIQIKELAEKDKLTIDF